ncbi:MAG: hypothetical protein HZA36_00205 [Parcubacteria group bacterium]|nr:hypothetical protein [Parcubacteria group bacterium]
MNEKQKHWFMRILEGLVVDPDVVNFCFGSGLFDLEIIIKTAEEHRANFTPVVLGALETLVTTVTGISNLKIHLEGSELYKMREIESYM